MSQPDKLTSLRAYQPYSASKFCFSPRCSPPLQINHQESPKNLKQTSFSLTLWVVFLQICFKLLALLPLHESLCACHKLQGPSINLTLWIGVCDTHHVSISTERPYPYPLHQLHYAWGIPLLAVFKTFQDFVTQNRQGFQFVVRQIWAACICDKLPCKLQRNVEDEPVQNVVFQNQAVFTVWGIVKLLSLQ